ncbi:MAG: ROK family protein [Planctomycetes bacterium]|nr:ROK family protein [Planctomycetota bacterium]
MAERKQRFTGPIVGVDLGGTNISIGVIDEKGRVLGRCRRKTKAVEGRERVVTRLVEGIERACEDAKLPLKEIEAAGVGAPSAVDWDKGSVIHAGNLGWKKVPLRDILSKRLEMPVVVDNDVNVAALGESRLGAGKNRGDLLAMWIGTGIGGGLILNGKLWRGPFHTAGEVGHVVLFPGAGPGHRSLEDHCSRTAMVRSMMMLLGHYPDSMLREFLNKEKDEEGKPDPSAIGSGVLAECYSKGDPLVRKVVDASAELLGLAIANFITVLSLRTVVLGGGVSEALGKPYLYSVHESFERTVFPQSLQRCEIVPSELGDDAGMLGAALLARETLQEEKE